MPEGYEKREYQYYCPKCGSIHFIRYDSNELCSVCKTKMIETPHEYELSLTKFDEVMKLGWKQNKHIIYQSKQKLVEEIISKSPEFDQFLYDHKDEIMKRKETAFWNIVESGKAIIEEKSRVPKCPTCQSTNIRKMSRLETGTSVAVFGLFSRKINKTFKCNHCGYTW